MTIPVFFCLLCLANVFAKPKGLNPNVNNTKFTVEGSSEVLIGKELLPRELLSPQVAPCDQDRRNLSPLQLSYLDLLTYPIGGIAYRKPHNDTFVHEELIFITKDRCPCGKHICGQRWIFVQFCCNCPCPDIELKEEVSSEESDESDESSEESDESDESSEESEESDEAKYNFEWIVSDESSENNYGHKETRDGDDTQGSYYVRLPDGRLQIVQYHVDGDNGYVANVEYIGEFSNSLGRSNSYDDTQGSFSVELPDGTHQKLVELPDGRLQTYAQLPDGRLQTITFNSDGDNGYVIDVE